jgi:hypothetical protein
MEASLKACWSADCSRAGFAACRCEVMETSDFACVLTFYHKANAGVGDTLPEMGIRTQFRYMLIVDIMNAAE